MNILLVCTGNTCRSPMAKGLLEKLLDEEGYHSINVDSAGINVYVSTEASENAIQVMRDMDIDISDHMSRQVTREDIEEADIILGMTPSHRNVLIDLYPQYADKFHTLKEYAFGIDEAISDPFGEDIEAYAECATEISEAIEAVFQKIKEDEV
ncbi:MAG: low molecular weight protein arginine phosphatase [Ruminococcaceae bacterium]|nr:low molecular weight protein arginine phosphatase [Oscillospiraceae bacterium]